jgi:hypothetical protein
MMKDFGRRGRGRGGRNVGFFFSSCFCGVQSCKMEKRMWTIGKEELRIEGGRDKSCRLQSGNVESKG